MRINSREGGNDGADHWNQAPLNPTRCKNMVPPGTLKLTFRLEPCGAATSRSNQW